MFSAIVTTFFTQSLTGLSQDPGDRTNELLQNLTEILIATSGVNASQLTISSPAPFQPDRSAVRLNIYWSLSLILSVSDMVFPYFDTADSYIIPQISVAALAVISRGYVTMLTRSRHTQPHKRLGDLHRRWEAANKLLAPAVEWLPQLLVLPVVLFVTGLLDNVFSSSLPLTNTTGPMLFAGILASTFSVSVAIYTLWTVYHGLVHPNISPFQSKFLAIHGSLSADKHHQVCQRIASFYRHYIVLLGNTGRQIALRYSLPRHRQI